MLQVLKSNPRYFTDGTGKAIYLAGSHTWTNFRDFSVNDNKLVPFDYTCFLDFLKRYNFNFIRLWTWELPRSSMHGECYPEVIWRRSPFAWQRTGPGNANDGRPRFDFTKFDQSYFDRMRSRVIEAGKRGVYVSVMLFSGIELLNSRIGGDGFPFDDGNNINGIACSGTRARTLLSPQVTAIQEAYVKKVIDTVNDLDNVLYEICNESGDHSIEWQYHMIDLIKSYEKSKPQQHPVGITAIIDAGNAELFSSSADWISPADSDGYSCCPSEPPASDGSKVVVNDTDHSAFYPKLKVVGQDGHREWVWKNFTRGNNILFMDPYLMPYPGRNATNNWTNLDPYWDVMRANIGYTRNYAEKVNLAEMKPYNELASTHYCLANPVEAGAEYIVYLPVKEKITVDLSASKGELQVEWFDPYTGTMVDGGMVNGGVIRSFTPGFERDALLYIYEKKNG